MNIAHKLLNKTFGKYAHFTGVSISLILIKLRKLSSSWCIQ